MSKNGLIHGYREMNYGYQKVNFDLEKIDCGHQKYVMGPLLALHSSLPACLHTYQLGYLPVFVPTTMTVSLLASSVHT